jgi:integrase
MRKTLTDRTLKALRPGARYDVMDTVVPGFGVRVSETGKRTFILVGRFGGSRHPTRRSLGEYGVLTLEQARQKARGWIDLLKQDKDPAHEEARQQAAEARQRAVTFAAVFEDFTRDKLNGERRGAEAARDIRKEFLPTLGNLPIAEITAPDVLAIVRRKKAAGAPAQARALLEYAKRMFQWAVDSHAYGLTASPIATVKPSKIVGDKVVRDRTLTDDELFALWRAASRMRYPHGDVYRLLLLTGLRLNEACDAHWSEVNRQEGVWVIPRERMKGKEGKARPHAVPLTGDIGDLLAGLPTFQRGKFLFSATFGATPVWMTDKIKRKLDARMLRTLRALAKRRGDDPADVALPAWKNHDIRRTVRTRLSRLKISEEAREAVLAHARPGVKGAYDHHDYLPEKIEACELWADALRRIVEPPPPAAPQSADVIALASRPLLTGL